MCITVDIESFWTKGSADQIPNSGHELAIYDYSKIMLAQIHTKCIFHDLSLLKEFPKMLVFWNKTFQKMLVFQLQLDLWAFRPEALNVHVLLHTT